MHFNLNASRSCGAVSAVPVLLLEPAPRLAGRFDRFVEET
jgi:hypothetical protein